jgi:hypothetical protein
MTLNQKYKQSKTTQSFKDWLFDQQKEGSLDFNNQEVMNQETETDKKIDIQLFGIPVMYIGIGVVLILGGYWAYNKFRK